MSTFPLCGEDRHEAAIRGLIDGCVEFVRRRVPPPTLVAVVLTGSFARGEGTVLPMDGRLKVLGDIEFFVVLARSSDYLRLRTEMATWGAEAAATLCDDRVHAELEFGPVAVDYLHHAARPSIFVHDLRHHGKVLWGPPELLEGMPAFGSEDIPREDALRLLLNRTIEQLDAYDRIPTLTGDAFLDVGYQRLKVLLDLAGSALAFSGSHCASYAQRPAALARLIKETPSLARRLPSSFERELGAAARIKLEPDLRDFTPAADVSASTRRRALRAQILAAGPAITGLLHWELEQLFAAVGDLDDLLDRYLRAPSFGRRSREWLKLLVNPKPAPRPISLTSAARLLWRSTPRELIHAAGALAFRNLHAPSPVPDPLGRLLPLDGSAGFQDAEARRRAIVALWRWCVRNS